jgi:hypothetical protein
MKDHTAIPLEKVAERFTAFGIDECQSSSKLYHQLVDRIATDTEMLEIAAHVTAGQPIPNSFLAAVHYLLLLDPSLPLARYYPSVSGQTSEEIPYDMFRAFVIENKTMIIDLISTRLVQTNVIGRCSYMAAIFSLIIVEHPGLQVTTIDIGTSAGLTLNWDQYEYLYSNGMTIGHSKAKVLCEVRGGNLPPFTLPEQPIKKIGIDQNVMDPTDPGDARWLRALIWPDQLERFAAMEAALQIDDLKRIEFIEADSVSDFERVIASVPVDDLLIVYCTHAMYQFPMEMRTAFWEMLDRQGSKRDMYFLLVEGIQSLREKYNSENSVAELTSYNGGIKTQRLMAEANSHGKWFIWRG